MITLECNDCNLYHHMLYPSLHVIHIINLHAILAIQTKLTYNLGPHYKTQVHST